MTAVLSENTSMAAFDENKLAALLIFVVRAYGSSKKCFRSRFLVLSSMLLSSFSCFYLNPCEIHLDT